MRRCEPRVCYAYWTVFWTVLLLICFAAIGASYLIITGAISDAKWEERLAMGVAIGTPGVILVFRFPKSSEAIELDYNLMTRSSRGRDLVDNQFYAAGRSKVARKLPRNLGL